MGLALTCAVWMLAGLAPSVALAAEYKAGPAPGWVIVTGPGNPTDGQLSKDSDGVSYLLVDTQERHDEEASTRFRRVVSRALNPHGVESVANIEIQFDPSYQALTLHAVDLVRGGRVIHKLATAKVRVIQRETELDARIFDGMKSANIFLDDVRVGDVVDYAYSVSGRNPVFAGGTFGRVALQYGVPAARVHARVLVPEDEVVTVSTLYSSKKPSMTRHDGFRDYEWNISDDPGLAIEAGAPSWYDPRPAAAFSSFADWNAVARWAQTLYVVPKTLSQKLESEVARIAKAEKSQAGRMLATLRLVQSEVRYLGVEVGVNSHMPNSPSLVFDRRFGDCKDKALLTVSLLSRLGIDANVALVNTTMQQGLAEELPSPGGFDHVIVRVMLDHQPYWLDPTLSEQRSDLAHLIQPDYGLALVVDPVTTRLVKMDTARSHIAKRSLHVVFDARKDFGKPVGYTITSTYEGREADSMRANLASRNLVDLQKNYLNWYASYYPHISVTAPLNVEDDEVNNRLTISEHYQIADIATVSEKDGKHTVSISTVDFDSLFDVPEVRIRKSPLALGFPLIVEQTTEVLLPSEWPITPEKQRVEDPAFTFDQTVHLDGLRLIITDHYQSLANDVAAKDMPRYLGNLARVRDTLDYSLSWTGPTPAAGTPASKSASPAVTQRAGMDRMNWPVAMLALAMLAIWGWLAALAYRYDPPARQVGRDGPEGLGGWLVLVAIGLVISPFIIGRALIDLAGALSADTWAALTTFGGANYHALWAPFLLVELVANLGQLVFAVLMLLLFFQRRTCFPKLMIGFYIASAALQGTDLMMLSLMPTIPVTAKDYGTLVRVIVTSIIWSAYLVRSRRVKATFVRQHRGKAVARAIAVAPAAIPT
jgi:transglutaminase-like putative cysteine protease